MKAYNQTADQSEKQIACVSFWKDLQLWKIIARWGKEGMLARQGSNQQSERRLIWKWRARGCTRTGGFVMEPIHTNVACIHCQSGRRANFPFASLQRHSECLHNAETAGWRNGDIESSKNANLMFTSWNQLHFNINAGLNEESRVLKRKHFIFYFFTFLTI